MGYLGEEIKKLGFGMMRLPKNGAEIDIEKSKEMVDAFMAAGFTYFDTAFVYPGSEDAVRQVLVERYPRERYQLATKIAPWAKCQTREDAIAQFETSLRRTGAGYFDFYLLHNLGEERTKLCDEYGIWSFVQEKKAEGLIKHVGFSFHSTPEDLDKTLTDHPEVEFVQLQINYVDWENPNVQSRGIYEVARKHNKPVIIMEPVKGGLLANPPERVAKIFQETNVTESVASWAVRFAANLEGVITVLSGMSTIEQVRDNISYMRDFKGLTKEQERVLERAREEFNNISLIPCTSCNYCLKVCPMQIGVAGTFSAMNSYKQYENVDMAKGKEDRLVVKAGYKQAKDCIECGACEAACPQHISIREELALSAKTLGQK